MSGIELADRLYQKSGDMTWVSLIHELNYDLKPNRSDENWDRLNNLSEKNFLIYIIEKISMMQDVKIPHEEIVGVLLDLVIKKTNEKNINNDE